MMRHPFLLGLALAGLALVGCNSPKDGEQQPKSDQKTVETAKAADSGNDSKIVPVGNSYTKGGGATAQVTIVEFSEFQCPFCARVLPTQKQILDTYGDKVRIVFKHNPLPFHQDAPLASQASLAAGKQGKFWEMHDKLFENQKDLKRESILGYAKDLGLDMKAFEADMDSQAVKDVIKADMELANKVGARGTPNFIINGKQVSGARPFESFKEVIDAELKEIEGLKDLKPEAIYAARVEKNFQAPKAPTAPTDTSKVVYKVPVGEKSYTKGGKEPLVTIVEFSEFECPFCARVLPTMKQIHDEYGDKVSVSFRHNPLPFHKNAMLASEAALAAGAQGKFWEMHDKLFENQKALLRENLEQYATDLGLDMTAFKADLDSGKFKAQILEDQKVAEQFGARGTPNFFVNGRQVTGARPYDAFKTIIDEEVKKAEAELAKGTPRSGIYAALTAKGLEKAAERPTQQPPADDKTVYKVPVEANDAAKGPADAFVTIVAFSEFQCPFCARVLPTMKQIEEKYGADVRVVFKHNPLPFHKEAPYAAQAALAAGMQGKFWELHDKMFANQRALLPENIDGYAKEIGLDINKFKADVDSQALKDQIKRDQDLANQIGAGGTPNFFINGRKLVGAQPIDSFTKVIDEELAKAKKMADGGIAKAGLYAEIIKNGATKPAGPAAAPAEDDTKVYDVKVADNDHFKGNKNAVITIVEFSEFQCPFCSRVNPTVQQILDTYGDKVKVVFKHNPLSFHQDAPLASEAALAAGEQGKFWEMHDMLFKNQRALKRENLEQYAQELGLNMDKFKKSLDSGVHKAQIEADVAQARALGATGTPSFFINGRKVRGAQPFERFKAVIDEELAKKK
jgi:protein-disulfide isomerase